MNNFDEAKTLFPGGVNSPVRAFNAVGGDPIFIQKAEGPYVYGEDGRRYIDFVQSWGPMVLGHNHPAIREAVVAAVQNGLGYGAPTQVETQLGRKVQSLVPSMEKMRFVNSGTEATMSAIRVARGYTGRDKLIKFEGCYHGHSDGLLVKAGSGLLTFGVPSSAGVPKSVAEHTLTAQFNDLASVEALFQAHPDDIACIILEPVAGNMNCVPGTSEFLHGLRSLCDQYGALLIFDEVMTGFRVDLGGVQRVHEILPDLTALGKVIGGGLPVGAFGGKADVMACLAPEGPVYQAGTLSGNPIAMHAGLAALETLSAPGVFDEIVSNTSYLVTKLHDLAENGGYPLKVQQAGTMFGVFITDQDKISSYADVMRCDVEGYKRLFHALLEEGVYLAPSAFETGFMSLAHTQPVLDEVVSVFERVLFKNFS